MRDMKKLTGILAILLMASFTGCGGRFEPINSFNGQDFLASVQGVFTGTVGTSSSTVILLPNSFYSVYGTASGNSVLVDGIWVGTGAPSIANQDYQGTFGDYRTDGSVAGGAAVISSVDKDKGILNGAIHELGVTTNVNFTRMPLTQYNYNTFANIDLIQGAWTGTDLYGNSIGLAIGFDGNVGGTINGCTIVTTQGASTITPDTGGRNFFNVKITLLPTCAPSPSGAITAVAVYYPTGSGLQLLIIGTNTFTAAQGTVTRGFLFAPTR